MRGKTDKSQFLLPKRYFDASKIKDKELEGR